MGVLSDPRGEDVAISVCVCVCVCVCVFGSSPFLDRFLGNTGGWESPHTVPRCDVNTHTHTRRLMFLLDLSSHTHTNTHTHTPSFPLFTHTLWSGCRPSPPPRVVASELGDGSKMESQARHQRSITDPEVPILVPGPLMRSKVTEIIIEAVRKKKKFIG